MMTRRDFEKFAGAIREHVDQNNRFAVESWERDMVKGAIADLAGDIADICESSNGAFDRERFMTACGL